MKPRPEIGSEEWLKEQLALGLGTDERDRPIPRPGDGQVRPPGR